MPTQAPAATTNSNTADDFGSDIPMGFGPSPKAKFVYVDYEKSDTGWYTWNHLQKEAVPIPHEALTGRVTEVFYDEKEFKGDMNPKARFKLRSGARTYVLETGLHTSLSRCLLATFAKVGSAKRLERNPLTITIKPGEEGNVFATLYGAESGDPIFYDYPQDREKVDDLFELVAGWYDDE